MFAGRKKENNGDDIVFLAINMYWEDEEFILPELPLHLQWKLVINTSDFPDNPCIYTDPIIIEGRIILKARSVAVLIAE